MHETGFEVGSGFYANAVTPEQAAAALRATEIANRIRPAIYIIASTRYTSTGLEALKKGADEVIVAEQAVAMEFYRRISAFMSSRPAVPVAE